MHCVCISFYFFLNICFKKNIYKAFTLVLDFNLIKSADNLIKMIITLNSNYSRFGIYRILEGIFFIFLLFF